jgi:hypothetical protein
MSCNETPTERGTVMSDNLVVLSEYPQPARNLVVPTAVVTSTVILTIGAWKVAGELVSPQIRRLTDKLKKENEKA